MNYSSDLRSAELCLAIRHPDSLCECTETPQFDPIFERYETLFSDSLGQLIGDIVDAPQLRSVRAALALSLRSLVDAEEWLADPFQVLEDQFHGASIIGRATQTVQIARSSLTAFTDTPQPAASEATMLMVLSAEEPSEVLAVLRAVVSLLSSRRHWDGLFELCERLEYLSESQAVWRLDD